MEVLMSRSLDDRIDAIATLPAYCSEIKSPLDHSTRDSLLDYLSNHEKLTDLLEQLGDESQIKINHLEDTFREFPPREGTLVLLDHFEPKNDTTTPDWTYKITWMRNHFYLSIDEEIQHPLVLVDRYKLLNQSAEKRWYFCARMSEIVSAFSDQLQEKRTHLETRYGAYVREPSEDEIDED
jgi:hypothetical protein